MDTVSPARSFAISIASLLVLATIDVLIPHAVGFLELGAMPWAALLVVLTAYAGGIGTIVAGTGILVWVLAVGPALAGSGAFPAYTVPLTEAPLTVRYGTLAAIASAYFVAIKLKRLSFERTSTRDAARDSAARADALHTENHALKLIHQKTRNRLATERSSITILYEQIQRLQSFDQRQVLDATLTTIRLMTGATSCVVYRFHEQNLELERVAVWPSRHEGRYELRRSLASTLEGHVVRTGKLFTLRHLIDSPELRALEDNRTMMCVPVKTGNQIWGVLTVGRLPFLSYNEHAEKSLEVIAAIVAPALDRSVPLVGHDHLRDDDTDIDTDGIMPYEQFTELLERKVRAAETLDFHVLAVIIELQTALGYDRQIELTTRVGERIAAAMGRDVVVSQYQQASQLALITMSTRSEAAGYLLLRVTDMVTGQAWTVADETVLPRALVGFGSSAQSGYDGVSLLRQAEQMLSVFRSAQP